MRKYRKWRTADLKYIEESYPVMPTWEIAANLDATVRQVEGLMKRHNLGGIKYKTRFVGEAKIQRILAITTYLLKGRWGIKAIQDRFNISERTAYRYLVLLESVGMPVEKDFNNKFFITTDSCPVCGKNHD